ncbi:exopolysaccharide biosynthesis protein [Tropicimonas isoalkanivorans]|uniref:Uncharacterized conserved protein n=1 Tax=Tropicimonas isoalkanivorans TaxID=441112 RepID=A0A1I1PKH4_9RHOB|nr:exopolysaccharide biosynthesis protein [Tropicimonas isoalkanivorans]SFD10236.1 Uncharacterized conserved protein [Tropicimonas isoalkanivorans]
MSDAQAVGADGSTETVQPIRSIVDQLDTLSDRDEVRISNMLEAFGSNSFLPVLIIPALLVVSPLSGVPLFSSVCGLTIAAISAQMIFGRDHIWLPDFLMRQKVSGERLRGVMKRLRKIADWLDRHSRERVKPLTRRPGRKTVQVLCLICGAAMPILELVPFSSSLLGAAVTLFVTSLLERDGAFALLGLVFMAAATAAPVTVLGML